MNKLDRMMKMKKGFRKVLPVLGAVLCLVLIGVGIYRLKLWFEERDTLKKVIERLSAESRIAEVLVTRSVLNEETRAIATTIKFLEFDAAGKPIVPRYFTFRGNIIQFQTLVVRFRDEFVKAGDELRGKSIYLFLKVFMLDGPNTQEFNLTETRGIPEGYKVPGLKSRFEEQIWSEFWKYALSPALRDKAGVKNAQIEAPGTAFLPGTIYTIKIEHDGGIRIDTEPLPEVLRGEQF